MSAQRPSPFGLLMQMFTCQAADKNEPASSPKSVGSKFKRSRPARALHVHPDIDGNTKAGRRFTQLVVSLAAEFGGVDGLEPNTAALIREVAWLSVWIEGKQGCLMRQEPIDEEEFIRYNNTVDRKREKLRLLAERMSRKPNGVASLGEILRGG